VLEHSGHVNSGFSHSVRDMSKYKPDLAMRLPPKAFIPSAEDSDRSRSPLARVAVLGYAMPGDDHSFGYWEPDFGSHLPE
jgi:hypothetical protein